MLLRNGDRACDKCGRPARRYLNRDWCPGHAPANPQPDPVRTMRGLQATRHLPTTAPPLSASALIDERAIVSGKRRASKKVYDLAVEAERLRKEQR